MIYILYENPIFFEKKKLYADNIYGIFVNLQFVPIVWGHDINRLNLKILLYGNILQMAQTLPSR